MGEKMQLRAQQKVSALGRYWLERDSRFQFAVLIAGLAAVVGVTMGWLLSGDASDVERWKELGYPGVFFLNFLASVSLVLPVPGLISLCGVSLLLSPLTLGVLAGVAETLGETSGYAIGYGGRTVVEQRRYYERIRGWMERRGVFVILIMSVIPNPLFDLVGITAGGVRYPLLRFLVTVLIGKTIKGILVAYSFYYGVTFLPWVE